jgi:hypothetical protein
MADYAKGEGSAEVRSGKIEAVQVRDAPYPHIDIEDESGDSRNQDKVPPAIEGPLIGTLNPTADPTKLGDLSGGAPARLSSFTLTPHLEIWFPAASLPT